jgi:FKBP-type peptidyl-prolyl cis-trans isomerase 2
LPELRDSGNCVLQNLPRKKDDKMNSGDFILIDYVARIKESGSIFDITKEDVAKTEGMYNPQFKYGPVPVIIDANFVLPGLNESLKEMKVGDKKMVEVPPEKGFGKREPDLIKLIPESKFKEQDIDTTPGQAVTVNRARGIILSNDGGRVRVDFNHPLAGKALTYDVEIKEEITDLEKRIKAIIYYFLAIDDADTEVKIIGKEAEIVFKKKYDVLNENKQAMANTIIKWAGGIEKVWFKDAFELVEKKD